MKTIRDFFSLEAASGIILLIAACLALIIDNSPWSSYYQSLFNAPLQISFLNFKLNHNFLFWINDGLMVIFFLLISLELKREICRGELSDMKSAILPAVAALGGMVIPALIYTAINFQNAETLNGWAIPVATDIAFALGVLALFSKSIPYSLKLFLLSLAIFDDLGAIIIIAFFHSHSISMVFLVISLVLTGLLYVVNYLQAKHLFFYLLIGFMLWFSVLNSGIHPTIAGVLLGFMIPLGKLGKSSPLKRLEKALHPWVSFAILPIFAFANAGISFTQISWATLFDYVTLGIILGLFIGKQLGVFVFSWGLVKLGFIRLPRGVRWVELYGVALLCGIGFTMSLFLGSLAFADSAAYINQVRLGVLIGSLLSGIAGGLVLLFA